MKTKNSLPAFTLFEVIIALIVFSGLIISASWVFMKVQQMYEDKKTATESTIELSQFYRVLYTDFSKSKHAEVSGNTLMTEGRYGQVKEWQAEGDIAICTYGERADTFNITIDDFELTKQTGKLILKCSDSDGHTMFVFSKKIYPAESIEGTKF